MALEIKEIGSKKELKKFIKFQIELYKGVPQFVPPFIDMELSTVLKGKNPAFDHCEAKYWMAYQDGKAVGRIGAIFHGKEIKEKSIIRFGWFDFIDDKSVSKALMNEVFKWAKEKNLQQAHGPMGFTDLDFQGALVHGFDKVMTQAGLFNYPYYLDHYAALGFEKSVDWVELRKIVPAELPVETSKIDMLKERYGMQVHNFTSAKQILKYGQQIFDLLNTTYSHLYGYYELTQRQIDYFIKMYFGFVKPQFVQVVTNEKDEVIGFALLLPSLSHALRKAKGELYPFGFIHVLKAFNKNDTMDLFLIASREDYKRKGVNAVIWSEAYKQCIKFGVKYVHTGQMLEENKNVLNLALRFDDINPADPEIRRRCYIGTVQ